ncbi:hypothetical protein Dimus_033308 [Dionaea muscipula]
MVKVGVKYAVVDAFTDSAFKGNPAAVCLLEEDKPDEWLHAVAREFNISATCYLARLTDSDHHLRSPNPRFKLRWFTPVAEVVLPSAEAVKDVQPQIEKIQKCPGRGIIISGEAPPESGFDFFSRFFCPKIGINEDPVCGSAHCALAPYWSKRLNKCDFVAYAASRRGGVVKLHLDEENNRVKLQGIAVTIMEGSILV